jgi:hypothetical protein
MTLGSSDCMRVPFPAAKTTAVFIPFSSNSILTKKPYKELIRFLNIEDLLN